VSGERVPCGPNVKCPPETRERQSFLSKNEVAKYVLLLLLLNSLHSGSFLQLLSLKKKTSLRFSSSYGLAKFQGIVALFR